MSMIIFTIFLTNNMLTYYLYYRFVYFKILRLGLDTFSNSADTLLGKSILAKIVSCSY